MKDFFSISEAAKAVHTTAETLRHYDRIGLVKPGKTDPWTHYRYYTEEDLVRLSTVCALRQMDLPLQKIKEVLEYDDLEQIIDFLARAEAKADEKIAAIQSSKARILAARQSYAEKLRKRTAPAEGTLVFLPQRTILLSDTLETPTLSVLWNYLSHFYALLPEAIRNQFAFEDSAGVYTRNGQSRMFALCRQSVPTGGLEILPAGQYLCADCTEANRAEVSHRLLQIAETEYHAAPAFTVLQIVVSGILQWNYQAQVYLGTPD